MNSSLDFASLALNRLFVTYSSRRLISVDVNVTASGLVILLTILCYSPMYTQSLIRPHAALSTICPRSCLLHGASSHNPVSTLVTCTDTPQHLSRLSRLSLHDHLHLTYSSSSRFPTSLCISHPTQSPDIQSRPCASRAR